MSPADFCATLLRWYAANGRDLPWRHTRDPYAIWLSEVILQQTRISQGTAYWQRFMQAWPTVETLAAATEDEVLKMWQGLGYYSRARNLHTAARQIVALGQFPRTLEEIRLLKGVGDYTAAAIASLAFGVTAAAVDGNVYRVLSRLYAAMMDFGATQCTPQSPLCLLCPFMEDCEAHRRGIAEELPVKLKKTKITTRHLIYIYVRTQGYTAIHRRGAGDIWQGLWEPPLFEDQCLPQWPHTHG